MALDEQEMHDLEDDEHDGYSPIARLERQYTLGLRSAANVLKRSGSMWVTVDELRRVQSRLETRNSSTDLAHATHQYLATTDSAIFTPKRISCSEAETSVLPEIIAESTGAAGDRYRFRYSKYSPESAYSPIAGVKPCPKSHIDPSDHVFCSHVDADGAVCSEPVLGPLSLVIRTPDGKDYTLHVKDGMQVKHLKEKLWNMLGIPPSQQQLIMVNGGEAADSMPFAGSGLQPFDVLYLKQA